MGIHGLWPLLEPTSTAVTLDALEGKRLAIDVSFWLYQAQQGFLNTELNAKNPHLTLLINRIAKLLFYKIRPVFVFDGEHIPRFKKQILRDRCLKRHLKEIVLSRGQKRLFERMAKEQVISSVENSLDGFYESDSPTKAAKKFLSSVNGHFDMPSTSSAAVNNSSPSTFIEVPEDSDGSEPEESEGIYSSKLDAQITRLEEAKERARNARLRPSEIPDDSNQFSQFQLQRLVGRNEIRAQLDKLRTDKARNTIQLALPLDGDERRLIVTDKQQRTHILTRSNEIQVIEPEETKKPTDMTWPKFLQYRNEEEKSKEEKEIQQAIIASLKDAEHAKMDEKDQESQTSSEDDYDDDFIEVSDLEDNPAFVQSLQQQNNSNSDEEIIPIPMNFTRPKITFDQIEKLPSGEKSSDSSIMELDEEQANKAEEYFLPKNGSDFRRNNDQEGIYADCQKLLTLLGIPFMQAPAEAEAQCVELEQLHLVDGVVSDDSDVWLFGAREVYKNMFSRQRQVQRYRADEIKQKLGLGRPEFIQVGMLAGGDYSRGLEHIGMVAALELVSEFVTAADKCVNDELEKALQSLQNIRKWILSKREENSNGKKDFTESARRIRLRKIIEANNSDEALEEFPNVEVFEAYTKPMVNKSAQKFRWKRVDFKLLDSFLEDKLGLSKQLVDKMTHGAFARWDEFMAQQTQTYQARITDFARPMGIDGGIIGPSISMAPTQRVQKALEKLKRVASNEKDEPKSKIAKSKSTTSRAKNRRNNRKGQPGRNRRNRRKTATNSKNNRTKNDVEFTLSEESSSSPSSDSDQN